MTAEPPPLPHANRPEDKLGNRMLIPVGRTGWAIAAGYLGLFSVLLLPAPISIIVSIIAMRDLKRRNKSKNKRYGMGRAVFGLIMGILGTVALIVGVALAATPAA